MIADEIALKYKLEKFYYREARLLDEAKFDDWLDLFDEQASYWMPTIDTQLALADSVRPRHELPLFDDDKAFLEARVARLKTGQAHAESPASRTRHYISNIEILAESSTEIETTCNILVLQSRLERSECMYFGKREDRITIADDQWRITQRKIVLDQTMLPRAISILF